jgi:hypothetical protein
MRELRVETLTFTEAERQRWRAGHDHMLLNPAASPFLKRVLAKKHAVRPKRFFGEAFVASHRPHNEAYYSPFKWLTSTSWASSDLAIARMFKLRGARTAQIRIEMYNAFNVVVYNARQTHLQLVSPTNETVRNSQFLSDGTVDTTRLKTTSAGLARLRVRSRCERFRRSCDSRFEDAGRGRSDPASDRTMQQTTM